MGRAYDMIIIGAGSGGLSMALGLHKLGIRVLLIDRSDTAIGGECLNTGCIPSKAFIHTSKIIHSASLAGKYGLQVQGKPSMEKIWQYVESVKDKIRTHENYEYFKQQNLDVELGTARFTGKNQVAINGKRFVGKKITIATGSKPMALDVPGVELVQYYNNENIWDLSEVPSSILFVGAGPVNMELAQAFARIGCNVAMVEVADRILVKEPEEVSEILYHKSVELGIDFYLNSKVERFTDANTALIKTTDNHQAIQFELLVAGIGRKSDFSGLHLEAAGVAIDQSGALVVDEYLRTTNKNILAIGDAAGGPRFSHAAELQATILISNLFSPFKKKIRYHDFSRVTFTDPEVATFGHSEEALVKRGKGYRKLVLDFDEDDRAIAADYSYGKMILYITDNRNLFPNAKLLGGSLIAPAAGEMVQELILAKSAGLGIKSLFNKTYPYPTASRVNKSVVMNHYISTVRPWMKKILKILYASI